MSPTVGQTGGRLLGMVAQAAAFAVLARRFDDAAFAPWLAAVALLQIAAVVAEFGLPISQQVVRTGTGHGDTVIGPAFLLVSLAGASTAAVVVGIGPWVGVERPVLIDLLPWFAATRLQVPGFADALFGGRWTRAVCGDLIGKAACVVLCAALPWRGASTANFAFFAGAGLTLVLTLPARRRAGRVGSLGRRTVQLGRASLAPGLAQAMSAVHGRNDQVVLGRSVHHPELPGYSAAYRLFEAGVAVAGAAAGTLIGDLSRVPERERRRFVRARLRQGAFLGAGAALGLAVLGPTAVGLLLGRHDPAAVRSAFALAPAVGLAVLNGFAARCVYALGGGSILVRRQVGAVLGNLSANVVVIPLGGAVAAAGTTLAFEVIWTLVSLSVLRSLLIDAPVDRSAAPRDTAPAGVRRSRRSLLARNASTPVRSRPNH